MGKMWKKVYVTCFKMLSEKLSSVIECYSLLAEILIRNVKNSKSADRHIATFCSHTLFCIKTRFCFSDRVRYIRLYIVSHSSPNCAFSYISSRITTICMIMIMIIMIITMKSFAPTPSPSIPSSLPPRCSKVFSTLGGNNAVFPRLL